MPVLSECRAAANRTATVHFASRSQMTTWCARRTPSSGSGRCLAPGAMKTPSGLQIDEEEPVVSGAPERRPHVCREEVPASSLRASLRTQERSPRGGPTRCRASPVVLAHRADRACRHPMPERSQCAVNAAVVPAVVLTSPPDHQVAACLPQARPGHPPGHVSPLPGDQTAMPAHQRIGGDARGDGVERPSPEEPGRRRQSTTLTVRQPELPATTRLVEAPVLLDQGGDNVLLRPLPPARNRQQKPRERESRGRHSALVGTLNSHAHRQVRTDPFFAQGGAVEVRLSPRRVTRPWQCPWSREVRPLAQTYSQRRLTLTCVPPIAPFCQ